MSYQAGDILLNKYRVESLVGRGAFGEVYHVVHQTLGVSRAVKVLRRDAPGVGSQGFQIARERFTFEAQLGARLNHPNVIQVHEFEEDEGELFLILEYAPGSSLEDRLKVKGQLTVEEVVQMGLDLCKGLHTIYNETKAVHRDLKPSNILFGEDGTAKIADLGLAQVPDDSSRRSLLGSLAGAHPGTPLYMSPEQASTRDILQPSSDIFSLGCLLFEALTGIAYKNDFGTHVSDHQPEVPPWLDEIISRGLAEQPGRVPGDDEDKSKRYRKVEYLQKALQQGWISETGKADDHEERGKLRAFIERIPRWGWALGIGIILVVAIGFALQVNKLSFPIATPKGYSELVAIETQSTKTLPVSTAPTLTRTPTNTIAITPSPTHTIPQTLTETITPAATLEAGTIQISPVDDMVMVFIPSGEFIMGIKSASSDERPSHNVYLDSYWIDQTEITNGMYNVCVSDGVCGAPANETYFQNDKYTNHPVVHVNWNQAQDYCVWTGRRLPTEAEWEKAARGLDERTFPWGEGIDCTKAQFGWCDESSMLAVGSKPKGASLYSVLDMAGNVWEWVADWYQEDYFSDSQAQNPTGPLTGNTRVIRGGGWDSDDSDLRISNRYDIYPESNYNNIGFRCAMNDASSAQQILTPTAIHTSSFTFTSTFTVTPPPTKTILPTGTDTSTLTPNLMAGATRISPVDDMVMVYVPAGEFLMGINSIVDGLEHIVYLESYWIDKTEVTTEMFALFLNSQGNQIEAGKSWIDVSDDDSFIKQLGDYWVVESNFTNYPANNVNWYGAQAYCVWAGKRLPTEAEWEKAARGLDGRIFPWGSEFSCDFANGGYCGFERPVQVGGYPEGKSPFGALDMTGNVSEWVNDWYSGSYYYESPESNPAGPTTGNTRVVRGGSYKDKHFGLQVGPRADYFPFVNVSYLGFRCAMDAEP